MERTRLRVTLVDTVQLVKTKMNCIEVVKIFVSFKKIWNSAPLNFPTCVPISVRLSFACLLPRPPVSLQIVAVFWNDVTFIINLFQMKPTMCTLLLSVFISTSLHVSGNYVTIIRGTYSIYATLVFFTLYGWLSGLLQQSWLHFKKITQGCTVNKT